VTPLPAGVVLAVTGLMVAVILGGAISNLADRAADGLVTDYLHTGWFPTFNGADVLITVGAAALLLTAMRPGTKATQGIASCGGAR
jgi:signal peptidase II